MGRKSKIAQLDPQIRDEVDHAITRGATIADILEMLRGLGVETSMSAVGRYSKNISALAERQRDLGTVATALGKQFGEEGDDQTRLMVQLVTSLITGAVIPMLTDDNDQRANPMELQLLARAMKDTTSAAQIEDNRRRAIRKEALADASKAVETTARAEGVSQDKIDAIKARIMGLAG